MRTVRKKTNARVRQEGLRALFQTLGHDDACRFLQDLGLLKGDWTQDRDLIVGWMSLEEIAAASREVEDLIPPQVKIVNTTRRRVSRKKDLPTGKRAVR